MGPFCFRIIEESPRWLVSIGRFDEAERIMQKMAKVNKKPVTGNILDPTKLEISKTQNFIRVFKYRVLFIRTLIIFWNWWVNHMYFARLSVGVTSLRVYPCNM